MNITELAQQYAAEGFTSRGDLLFSPTGHLVSGLIKTSGTIYFAEQIARALGDLQRSSVERGDRRSLRGTIWHTKPHRGW